MLTVSSVPGKKLPEIALWNWDKLAHTFEYLVFAFLLFRYFYSGKNMTYTISMKLSLPIGIAYGGIDELHQMLIPNRSCTWQDLIADSIGVILGAYLAVQFYKRKHSHEKHKS
jgi:VanZ family protein